MATFDAAKHFNTAPEFVTRMFNRPTLDSLESQKMAVDKLVVKVTDALLPPPHNWTKVSLVNKVWGPQSVRLESQAVASYQHGRGYSTLVHLF